MSGGPFFCELSLVTQFSQQTGRRSFQHAEQALIRRPRISLFVTNTVIEGSFKHTSESSREADECRAMGAARDRRRKEDEVSDISKGIDINASGNDVFDVLTNLACLPLWSTITLETHGTPRQPIQEGDTFEQTLRVLGTTVRTQWRVGELERPLKVAYEAEAPEGGVLRMIQRVHDKDGVSRVEVELEYELPGGFLRDATEAVDPWVSWVVDDTFAGRRNEGEPEHSLRNLKELVEARKPRQ
jgi:hypothetical protein